MTKRSRVRDIICKHPRERLFVQPLEWTPRHLELLQCTFEESKTTLEHESNNTIEGEPKEIRKGGLDRWTRNAKALTSSELKTATMKKLLTDSEGPLKFIRPFGYFCFTAKHEFRLHGALFSQRSAKSQFPIFAFLQRGMIRIQREGVFTLPRPRRPNPPAEHIRQLRLKQIEPEDPWRYPYILAVLVGMAQSQAEAVYSGRNGTVDDPENFVYKVSALMIDETNTDFMCFYAAHISTPFLYTFQYPEKLKQTKRLSEPPSLSITCKQITYQPYETLRQRLIQEIDAAINSEEK